jgi:hypothetical protein
MASRAQIEKRVLKLAHVEERRRVCRLEKASRRCVKPAARLTEAWAPLR